MTSTVVNFQNGARGEASGPHVGANPLHMLKALTVNEILARTFPPRDRILGPWLCRQDLTMVFAARGVERPTSLSGSLWRFPQGKTFLDGNVPSGATYCI